MSLQSKRERLTESIIEFEQDLFMSDDKNEKMRLEKIISCLREAERQLNILAKNH